MYLESFGNDWRSTIKNPLIGEMYFDPISFTMWEFKKIGDFPPEWVNVTPYEEENDPDKFR